MLGRLKGCSRKNPRGSVDGRKLFAWQEISRRYKLSGEEGGLYRQWGLHASESYLVSSEMHVCTWGKAQMWAFEDRSYY